MTMTPSLEMRRSANASTVSLTLSGSDEARTSKRR
ncbi:Uncharacterised protein [Bordetella pertussis]|nr:Uncharacterised protein [Bordetella pertussis]